MAAQYVNLFCQYHHLGVVMLKGDENLGICVGSNKMLVFEMYND